MSGRWTRGNGGRGKGNLPADCDVVLPGAFLFPRGEELVAVWGWEGGGFERVLVDDGDAGGVFACCAVETIWAVGSVGVETFFGLMCGGADI